MAVGDIIDRDDYNSIQTIASRVLGTGSSNSGYGQPVLSSPVSTGQRVTIQEWDNVRNDIINIYRHQNGTIPTLPSAAEGAKVRYNTTNSVWNKFLTEVQTLNTNRFDLGALQFSTTNQGSAPNFESLWKNALTCIVTVTFNSGEEARHFFNSGGKIEFTSSRSGGTESGNSSTIAAQNANWTALLDGASPAVFGGSTSLTLNGSNYFGCTSSYTSPYFSATGTSAYSTNDWTIYARTPGVANNNSGSASTIEFRVEWNDDHVPQGRATVDGVDGTLTLSSRTIDPVFNLVPASAVPNPISVPTTTFSSITGS